MPDLARWDGDDLVLALYVQPRASRDEFAGVHGNALKVRTSAPPVDGKANAQLVKFLARAFGVPRGHVALQSGAGGRRKTFRIHAPRRLPRLLENAGALAPGAGL